MVGHLPSGLNNCPLDNQMLVVNKEMLQIEYFISKVDTTFRKIFEIIEMLSFFKRFGNIEVFCFCN